MFIVPRTECKNLIINEFIKENIRMGDRMIVIRPVDGNLLDLTFKNLKTLMNKD